MTTPRFLEQLGGESPDFGCGNHRHWLVELGITPLLVAGATSHEEYVANHAEIVEGDMRELRAVRATA
jgi:hypothetical protein